MEKNCLVTKLNGLVDNNSLPTINTIFLDYIPASNSDDAAQVIVYNKPGDTVTITFKSDVYTAANGQTVKVSANTPFVIDSSVANIQNFFVVKSMTGNNKIDQFVKLENPYNCYAFCTSGSLLRFDEKSSNSIQSFLYNKNIKMFGGNFYTTDGNISDIVPNTTEYLAFSNSAANTIDVKYIVEKCANIKYINTYKTIDENYPAMTLFEGLSNNTSIFLIYARFIGDVTNLPLNTRSLGINTSLLTGDLIDFVNFARSNGRTTGTIRLISGNGPITSQFPNVKYNGTNINTFESTVKYMNWTQNDVTFTENPVDSSSLYEIPSFTNYANSIQVN